MPVTFSMVAVIEFQHTFTDAELEQDEGAAAGDPSPSDAAMEALVLALEHVMRPAFLPRRVELEADVVLGRG